MFLTNQDFKSSAKQNKSLRPTLRKAMSGATSMVGERQIRFIFSSPNMDRDFDIIDQEGIDYSTYATNPIVLWSHDSSTLPIGKCISIGVENGMLTGVVEFVPESNPEVGRQAEGIYQLCRDGYLNATSIGFIATEWKFSDDDERYARDGTDITKCELAEISLVNIPSNRQAIIQDIGSPETIYEPVQEQIAYTETPKKYHAPRLQRQLDAFD